MAWSFYRDLGMYVSLGDTNLVFHWTPNYLKLILPLPMCQWNYLEVEKKPNANKTQTFL